MINSVFKTMFSRGFRLPAVGFVGASFFYSLFHKKVVSRNNSSNKQFAIAVNAGAGSLKKTPEEEEKYLAEIKKATKIGYDILKRGGTSVDAVTAAIVFMEDCPLFNSGKGSSLTNKGTVEMDASIMDGLVRSKKGRWLSGAVLGVKTVKNPIKLAREVMEKSDHILLAGQGAENFAVSYNVETASKEYFLTAKAKASLSRAQEKKTEKKYGTVGAVAIDKRGSLAAGTSTGGMTNRMVGRVGDSAIVGAGTYALNSAAAISCTGKGEEFIQNSIASNICWAVKNKQMPLGLAVKQVLHSNPDPFRVEGGIIGVDSQGNVIIDFNTLYMSYGYITSKGERKFALYEKSNE